MKIAELARIFLRERDEPLPSGNSPMATEHRSVGTPGWVSMAPVQEDRRRGGFRVVLSARTAHLKAGAAPADNRNLNASVGAVFSRPDLGPKKGRIPGAWRSGSRGQFVSAAVYGFATEAAAKKAIAEAVRELGGDARLVAGMSNSAALADPEQRAASVKDRAVLAKRLEAAQALTPGVLLVELREETFMSYLPDEYWGERLYTEPNVARVEKFAAARATEVRERAEREEEQRLTREKYHPLFQKRYDAGRYGQPLYLFDTEASWWTGRFKFSEEGYAQFCARLDAEDAEQAAHEAKWAAIREQEATKKEEVVRTAEVPKQQPMPEPIASAPANLTDLQAKWGKKR